MTISPPGRSDLAEAFALLHGWTEKETSQGMARVFQLMARGELDADLLLVAKSAERIVGVIGSLPPSGGIAVLMPPRTRPNARALEEQLVAKLLDRVRDVRVVQAFLDEADEELAGPLLAAGFRRVTRVLQMERASQSRVFTSRNGIVLSPFRQIDPVEFTQTLMVCLEDSRDCPELHGMLSEEEILTGYCESAPDQDRWFLARVDGRTVGVLILTKAELYFIGVVPSERGRGLGKDILQAACSLSPRLSLIVDERNEPAIRMYSSLDFEVKSNRAVYLFSQVDSAGGSRTEMASE